MATSFKHPEVVDVVGAIAAWWRDLRCAASFLTWLPLGPSTAESPIPGLADGASDAAALPMPAGAMLPATALFPLVGGGIGLAAAMALLGAFQFGLHPLACALTALATSVILTAAVHEDGLADFADGLGARGSRENRLAAMRDSRIGTFGALAVIFGITLRASILGGLSSPEVAAAAVLAAAAMSRAVLPALLRWQRPARLDGLAAGFGMPTIPQVLTAIAWASAICVLAVGVRATLAAVVGAALTTLAVAAIAQRMLGGQTGDVLGAAQVLAEVAIMAAIAAVE